MGNRSYGKGWHQGYQAGLDDMRRKMNPLANDGCCIIVICALCMAIGSLLYVF